MNLKYEDLINKKIMDKADWLTVRNMVYPPSLKIDPPME